MYAVCWMCHTEMDKITERNIDRVRDTDRDKDMCDHKNLVVITDEKYLTEKYLYGCLDSGYKVLYSVPFAVATSQIIVKK